MMSGGRNHRAGTGPAPDRSSPRMRAAQGVSAFGRAEAPIGASARQGMPVRPRSLRRSRGTQRASARPLACALLLLALAPVAAGGRPGAGAPAGASHPYHFLEEESPAEFDLITRVRACGPGEVRLCFAYRDPGAQDYLSITNRTLSLMRVRGGKRRALAPPWALRAPLSSEPAEVVLKRRADKIAVICRGFQLLSAGDLQPIQGRVGMATAGGMAADEPRLQPVEPPALADDFMRTPDEPGPWESASGKWRVTSVARPERSANGFSFAASGSPGVTAAGFPFWDDYLAECAFRCPSESGAASIGLAVYYQDAANYLAVTWSAGKGMRLVRVAAGKTTVLARRGIAWLPDQWYRLGLQVVDGNLAAMVDGRVCLEACDASFGRGQVALLVEGGEAVFDDVCVGPAPALHPAMPAAGRDAWAESGGLRVIGSRSWRDYDVRAQVRPADAKGVRLVFAWRDAGSYFLFDWQNTPGAGRKRLIRVQEGRHTTFAEAPGGYRAGQAYTIEVAVRAAYAAVAIDGRRVLEGTDTALGPGAVGLDASAPSVRDLSIALRQLTTTDDDEVTKEFTNTMAHAEMARWAKPMVTVWEPGVTTDGRFIFWGTLGPPGDLAIELLLPPVRAGEQIALALAADGKDPATGYRLLAGPEAGGTRITLLRRARVVATAAKLLPGDAPARLALARHGGILTLDQEGKGLLTYRDPEPISGAYLAVQSTGVVLNLAQMRPHFPNTCEYTFTKAPVDWLVHSGAWAVCNRWSCDPTWTWFGGASPETALIWHKRRFAGDVVLHYFAAPKMEASTENKEVLRDLNALLCGDGEHPESGYAFVTGGEGRKTAILRAGKVVAECDFQLPPAKTAHRSWFGIRAEKRGRRVSLSVDNRELLAYDDPQPLSGDRVGLWTRNNGMMLARVSIAFEREEEMRLAVRAAYARVAPGSDAALVLKE